MMHVWMESEALQSCKNVANPGYHPRLGGAGTVCPGTALGMKLLYSGKRGTSGAGS